MVDFPIGVVSGLPPQGNIYRHTTVFKRESAEFFYGLFYCPQLTVYVSDLLQRFPSPVVNTLTINTGIVNVAGGRGKYQDKHQNRFLREDNVEPPPCCLIHIFFAASDVPCRA